MSNKDKAALINLLQKVLVATFKLSPEKAFLWLFEPNPNFGNATPAQLIEADRAHKVLNFMAVALEENIYE
jgi:hypothetical protein